MNQKNAPDHVKEKQRWINFEGGLRKWGALLLILIVFSGMAGVFSKGYLSEGHAGYGITRVEYERFGRVISDMDMKIIFMSARQDMSRVSLGDDFMENYEILTLHPQPFRAYSDGKRLILEYHLINPVKEQTVWLGLQPRTAGVVRTLITVDDTKPVSFFQLIYP